MMEEEGAVIVGLLVGLNVIDANLCVKGEDLDSQVSSTQYKCLVSSWLTSSSSGVPCKGKLGENCLQVAISQTLCHCNRYLRAERNNSVSEGSVHDQLLCCYDLVVKQEGVQSRVAYHMVTSKQSDV
jgi:hypothetical protein